MNNTSIAPSTAKQPDLDWSQVRETMRMLNLAVAQIDMAMREGEESIQTLSESFTSMIASVSTISQTAGQLQCRDENAGVITIQVSLRPRERFWDIPVPKIDSAFDSLFVPRPSR
ncbi:MAG: hypothetical protein JMN26_09620, partial [gamma proteobacterium endosymbiont of Lamellibrachia anaximandri]|nr:hypothetical protein [gamma proteobacterium endosymbiont of Lamellibrachia anaximandri]